MFDGFRTLNDSIVTFSLTFIAIFLGDLTDSVKSVKLTEALIKFDSQLSVSLNDGAWTLTSSAHSDRLYELATGKCNTCDPLL